MAFAPTGEDSPTWVYPKDDPEWKETIIKEFKIQSRDSADFSIQGLTDSKKSMIITTPSYRICIILPNARNAPRRRPRH